MEKTYLCPDCRAEHGEPEEALLGHVARCATCALLLEMLLDEAALREHIVEIRLAA